MSESRTSSGGRRRALRAIAFGGVAVMAIVCVVAAHLAVYVAALGPAPLGEGVKFSTEVLDRKGQLLRAYTAPDGRWRLPVRLEAVDPRFVDLLIAYEDRRFRSHHGVDALALARAAGQWLGAGRIVSGGSTITMQVARLLEPRSERSVAAKLRQMVRAVQLERALSKDEILSLYLALAPYGGNIEGLRAASLSWFGKEPRRLSLGEAALLVGLPQAPEARRPDRFAESATRARARVLDRVATQGAFPAEEIARARAEASPGRRLALPFLAPHAADAMLAANPSAQQHRLTLDATFQRAVETLARDRAAALGPDVAIGIVVADHANGEVLARVGSPFYFDERRAGQVDMTQAVRSPGSTLKPFIYGLAFEDGLAHPDTLIDDRPVRFGDYSPENFDQSFRGTVTVRRALQMSLNVPAVALLDRIGPSSLSARLLQAGLVLHLPKGGAPNLAMGLGGVGVRLTDLVALYGGLPRLGTTLPLRETMSAAPPAEPRRLMEPGAAWQVANVLIGTPAPLNAPGGRIAFKTGTSYGNRDAWAVGFDGRRVVGVWVGRPDGAPLPGLMGRTAAAPVLFDVFARSGQLIAPLPPAPRGVLTAANGKLPPPMRRFRPGADVLAAEAARPRILFPPQGAQIERETGEDIAVKVAGGVQPYRIFVNGSPEGGEMSARALGFSPAGPGFFRLTVVDGAGASDSVTVRLR